MRLSRAWLVVLLLVLSGFAQYRWAPWVQNNVFHFGHSDEANFEKLDGGSQQEAGCIFGDDAGVLYCAEKGGTRWLRVGARIEAIGANVGVTYDGGAYGIFVDGGGGGSVSPPTWHYFGTGGEPALQNGFTINRQHRYAKDALDFVHVELGIINPGAGTTGVLLAMPAGYWPPADLLVGNVNDVLAVVAADGGFITIAVNTFALGVPHDLNLIYSVDP